MTLYTVLFYAIAALITAATVLAITRQNLVHAVIYLVVSFFGSAALFYLLGAPLLAAFMVIIYAGAIMVLFLFIVMMLRVEAEQRPVFPARQIAPAVLIAAGYVLIALLMLSQDPSGAVPLPAARTEPAAFGVYVFRNAWLAIEITSLLLLVALVGVLLVGRSATDTEDA
jgi:NADH-quinone oxidoreductase subunit J